MMHISIRNGKGEKNAESGVRKLTCGIRVRNGALVEFCDAADCIPDSAFRIPHFMPLPLAELFAHLCDLGVLCGDDIVGQFHQFGAIVTTPETPSQASE